MSLQVYKFNHIDLENIKSEHKIFLECDRLDKRGYTVLTDRNKDVIYHYDKVDLPRNIGKTITLVQYRTYLVIYNMYRMGSKTVIVNSSDMERYKSFLNVINYLYNQDM
jgi:hypothetical protein